MILNFGKFKGKTIQQIFEEEEYSYILWLHKNVEKVKISQEMVKECISLKEAEDLAWNLAFDPFPTANDSF